MPESVPILPLRNAVLFPMTGLPLEAAQPRSLRLIDAVVNGDRRVVFVAQKDKELEGAGPNDLYQIGTLGVIQQMLRMPDGNVRLGVQGLERVRIGDVHAGGAVPAREGRAHPRDGRRGAGTAGVDAQHASNSSASWSSWCRT